MGTKPKQLKRFLCSISQHVNGEDYVLLFYKLQHINSQCFNGNWISEYYCISDREIRPLNLVGFDQIQYLILSEIVGVRLHPTGFYRIRPKIQ